MTSRAWRNAMGRIAFGHERAPTREQGRAHLDNRLRHWRRAQGCEVVRHLFEDTGREDIRGDSSSGGSGDARLGKRPAGSSDSLPACRRGAESSRFLSPRPAGRGRPRRQAGAPPSCRVHVPSAARARRRQNRASATRAGSPSQSIARRREARGSDCPASCDYRAFATASFSCHAAERSIDGRVEAGSSRCERYRMSTSRDSRSQRLRTKPAGQGRGRDGRGTYSRSSSRSVQPTS